MNEIYIITNEWDVRGESFTELVGGLWFATEDEAWDHLDDIARILDLLLEPNETSLVVPSDKSRAGVDYEEYRIDKLIKGGE